MSEDARLLRWASQLVDGSDVDWDTLRRDAPELGHELEGLRKLAARASGE